MQLRRTIPNSVRQYQYNVRRTTNNILTTRSGNFTTNNLTLLFNRRTLNRITVTTFLRLATRNRTNTKVTLRIQRITLSLLNNNRNNNINNQLNPILINTMRRILTQIFRLTRCNNIIRHQSAHLLRLTRGHLMTLFS